MKRPIFAAYAPESDRVWLNASFKSAVNGIREDGIAVIERRVGTNGWEPSDCLIINGWRKPGRAHTDIIDAQIAYGKPVLVIDRGYVRRKRYWSLGWNGLNGRADFCNADSPSDRWSKLGVELKPWRTDGEAIVVMGQVESDASVIGIDVGAWVRETIEKIRSLTDRPIIFRPHPKGGNNIKIDGVESNDGHISECLARAWAVVTYNSNTGVDAAIAGVPVFAADEGSMAWPVANRDLAAIETPETPDRAQWAANLAYAQWSLPEMAKGLAWERLKEGLR